MKRGRRDREIHWGCDRANTVNWGVTIIPGWSRQFDEPITLTDGRALRTLRDAGAYVTKLPKAEHTAPECQAAMEA